MAKWRQELKERGGSFQILWLIAGGLMLALLNSPTTGADHFFDLAFPFAAEAFVGEYLKEGGQ